ncbi:MAG: type II secretion system F family protein [Candidatus Riflebacteria bacterium]|nr:type II secretion system F family protein [Candidatus Riflebacteria bacterium]
MAKYECQVKNDKGELLKTTIEASNMQALTAMLSDKGFYLVRATEVKTGGLSLALGFGGVSQKDLMVFTVNLATLVGSSIPLVEAVGIMADQAENPALKSCLEDVGRSLQSGQTFSSALRKHPKIFNNIFCNMCEAGETGGILDQVLLRLANFAEADSKMRGKVKGALTLPVVQLVMAILCVVFLLVKIFPNFTKMFKKMKVELPIITKTMIILSDSMLENWMLWVGGTIAFCAAIYAFAKTDTGESAISWLSISLPIVGPITKKVALSRFSRTFCSLLGAGVPIMNALKITGSVMGNKALEAVVEKMIIGVQGGKGLTASIKGDSLFPLMVIKMMEVGENTGNLDKMLSKVADFYDQETAEALDGLTAAMVPIMTVGMGVMIGAIALSVFMPLFEMVTKMK